MIEYVEIRSAATRELIGVLDDAKSIIWHTVYYGVGDFEVYAPATAKNVALLSEGNYVTRYDAPDVGIIERFNAVYNAQDGRMIIAKGRFSKSILDRRIIYKRSGYSVSPTVLYGNVEAAARSLVDENAISCPFDPGRNIEELALGASSATDESIVDETGAMVQKQVTFDNLLTYTDALLQEYELGARCSLNSALQIAYAVYKGVDRSVGNASGNEPVIFSQDFDNLTASDYLYDMTALKNTALIGGEGEGLERFCSILKNSSITGIDRREVFVDASSSSKTYKDASDEEQTLTDAQYDQQLKSLGKQKTAALSIVETFDGTIDLTNGSFVYGVDFFLGDIVTVQDVEIGLYINPRLLEITEVQDDNGYMVAGVYGK